MIPFAVLDPTTVIAVGAVVISALGGVFGVVKLRPEAESIATRTTLEVIESQREQLKEAREEATQLRKSLRNREEELDALHRRFTTLRVDFDALEAELNALRGANHPA
jgi:predicted  nucleic acid-binding Zn-ribbon protein